MLVRGQQGRRQTSWGRHHMKNYRIIREILILIVCYKAAMDESRYKVNREIRAVLVRNSVDLSAIEFSFSGRTAWIRGELLKVDQSDFQASQIEDIAKDICRLPSVRELFFDLNNWTVASTGESWQVAKLKKVHGRMVADDRVIEISGED